MNSATQNRTASVTADGRSSAHENTLGQYIPLLYHYNMLQDVDRVEAFRRAIDLIVKPGMHVVELGGGTGILSSLAAKRGASVTCVERNPELVSTATRLVRQNGLGDSINVIHADATTFAPDRKVDVVVCEMLHVGLLREKQANVITAFKRNYAGRFDPKPLPIFIPEASILMVQLVEQSFDFAGYIAPVPMFQSPVAVQPRTIELSRLSPYANIDYSREIPLHFAINESITAEQTGHCNAIRLVTQNVLGIDEPNQEAITWANQHLVLPINHPITIHAGESIEIHFDYRSGDTIDAFQRSLKLTQQE